VTWGGVKLKYRGLTSITKRKMKFEQPSVSNDRQKYHENEERLTEIKKVDISELNQEEFESLKSEASGLKGENKGLYEKAHTEALMENEIRDKQKAEDLLKKIKGKDDGHKEVPGEDNKRKKSVRQMELEVCDRKEEELYEKITKTAEEFMNKYGDFLRRTNIYPYSGFTLATNCFEIFEDGIKKAKKFGNVDFPIFSRNKKELSFMLKDKSYLNLKGLYEELNKLREERKRVEAQPYHL